MLNSCRPFQLVVAFICFTRHCEISRRFVDSSIGGDDNDACIRNKNISVCLAPFYPLVACRFKRVKYPPSPTTLNDLMLSYEGLICDENIWFIKRILNVPWMPTMSSQCNVTMFLCGRRYLSKSAYLPSRCPGVPSTSCTTNTLTHSASPRHAHGVQHGAEGT